MTMCLGPTDPPAHHQLQIEERGAHADEGHGVQDAVDGEYYIRSWHGMRS